MEVDAGIDLGVDAATDPCEVVCVQIHPGEYRTECQGLGCPAAAYGICDADGGVLPAPVCARPGVSSEIDRVAACALDARGLALIAGPPVVRCDVAH